jgi:hypothetical protein
MIVKLKDRKGLEACEEQGVGQCPFANEAILKREGACGRISLCQLAKRKGLSITSSKSNFLLWTTINSLPTSLEVFLSLRRIDAQMRGRLMNGSV